MSNQPQDSRGGNSICARRGLYARDTHPEVADGEGDEEAVGGRPEPLVPVEGREDDRVTADRQQREHEDDRGREDDGDGAELEPRLREPRRARQQGARALDRRRRHCPAAAAYLQAEAAFCYGSKFDVVVGNQALSLLGTMEKCLKGHIDWAG